MCTTKELWKRSRDIARSTTQYCRRLNLQVEDKEEELKLLKERVRASQDIRNTKSNRIVEKIHEQIIAQIGKL